MKLSVILPGLEIKMRVNLLKMMDEIKKSAIN